MSEPKKVGMPLDTLVATELRPLSDVVTFCNHLMMSLYTDSTVVKSPEVVYRGMMLARTHLVAQDYLLNFRSSDADLAVTVGTNNYALPMVTRALANRDLEEHDDDLIALPPYDNVREPIGPVIRSRRSVRHYSGQAMSLKEVSTLLFHAAGISGRLPLENASDSLSLGGRDHVDLRTSISGGALYPIDLFILAHKVEKLRAGAYRYLPRHHALKPVASAEPPPELGRLAQFGEIQVEKAGFLLGYVYNVFENARKYGEAGLGFAFIEAGAIAAHVHLVGTAMGLKSCDVGSFSKPRFERLFEADGLSRHMIHLTVVGK
jgi:SagB-type dehydrogenase family enzyme